MMDSTTVEYGDHDITLRDGGIEMWLCLSEKHGDLSIYLDGGLIDSPEPFYVLSPEEAIRFGERLAELGREGLETEKRNAQM
jgi:hypothetical protein